MIAVLAPRAMKNAFLAGVLALALVPATASAIDCTSRPDLCQRPVTSDVKEPNLSLAIDLVFVGDGYTAAQLSDFAGHVAAYVSELEGAAAGQAILSLDRGLFNIHRVDVASATSDLGDGDKADTAFGAYAVAFDFITYDAEAALFAAAANAPDVDVVILVVNTTAGRANARVPSSHTSGGYVAVPHSYPWAVTHELGHALFSLGDEYSNQTACAPWAEDDLFSRANLTRDTSGRKFAQAGTPTPFEGASDYARCIYRPAGSCMMRSAGASWCPFCLWHLATQLEERRSGDRSKPYAIFLWPSPGAVLSQPIEVIARAHDTIALSSLELTVDGMPLASSSGSGWLMHTWDVESVAPGARTLTVTARDGAGHTDVVAITVTVEHPDREVPAVALTSPADAARISGAVLLSATATDASGVQSVEFWVAGRMEHVDSADPFEQRWETKSVPDGAHALWAVARDRVGNEARSALVTVQVDNTAPAVRLGAVARDAPIRVEVSDASPIARVELLVDGVVGPSRSAPPYEFGWEELALSGGAHRLWARAQDIVGNVGESEVAVLLPRGATELPAAAGCACSHAGPPGAFVLLGLSFLGRRWRRRCPRPSRHRSRYRFRWRGAVPWE